MPSTLLSIFIFSCDLFSFPTQPSHSLSAPSDQLSPHVLTHQVHTLPTPCQYLCYLYPPNTTPVQKASIHHDQGTLEHVTQSMESSRGVLHFSVAPCSWRNVNFMTSSLCIHIVGLIKLSDPHGIILRAKYKKAYCIVYRT